MTARNILKCMLVFLFFHIWNIRKLNEQTKMKLHVSSSLAVLSKVQSSLRWNERRKQQIYGCLLGHLMLEKQEICLKSLNKKLKHGFDRCLSNEKVIQ